MSKFKLIDIMEIKKKCYLCDVVLTKENASIEHIILNSIGGYLKTKELLCNACNSKLGHEADSELSKQLSVLSSFLQIKRDKGENQPIKGAKTLDGTEYHLVDGSKPILSKPTFTQQNENGKITYSIEARDKKECLNMLKGLEKKEPKIDLEAAKQKIQCVEEYLEENLLCRIVVGGELALKSIAKTAVNIISILKKKKNR